MRLSSGNLHDTAWVAKFILGFALLFGIIGIALLLIWRTYDPAAAVRDLLRPTTSWLEDAPAGRTVLIEAQISPRNPPQAENLVSYRREELRRGRDDDDLEWSVIERVTPPFLLDLPSGTIQILNSDYILERTSQIIDLPNGERLYGFKAGDQVVVIGDTASSRQGPALVAERVVGGTREEYLVYLAEQANTLVWIGVPFLGVGLVFAAIYWFAFRRTLR
jgi:hypothetical protein